MEKATDWIKLWRELVERQVPSWKRNVPSEKNGGGGEGRDARSEGDKWKKRAKGFDQSVREKWAKPGLHREFIASRVGPLKESTVLDIGAGTGAWSILLSKYARKVTAVEPSAAMRGVLTENLDREKVTNVEVLDGIWPDTEIEPHDFSLSSHSVYACADLPGFVKAMAKATRRTCFMLLRAPDHDGVMARAASMIWGQPNDSPNFQVAYNAMLQMGIFPDVMMEEKGLWPVWTNKNIDEAVEKIRSRFGVDEGSEHDRRLKGLLMKELKEVDGQLQWPSEVRTALVYWSTNNKLA